MSTTRPKDRPPSERRQLSRGRWIAFWMLGSLSFPIAGLASMAVAGAVDDFGAALVGGAVAGAVIGAGQSLASRGRLRAPAWILATSAGMGLGLAAGSTVVEFRTDTASLLVSAAIAGTVIGTAQALALAVTAPRRLLWFVALGALWPGAWGITIAAGVGVDAGFTNFGASGALVFTAVTGLILHALLPAADRDRRTDVGETA